VATHDAIYSVYDAVETVQTYPVAAIVRVEPARLHVVAR
jgi:hypothetical protein